MKEFLIKNNLGHDLHVSVRNKSKSDVFVVFHGMFGHTNTTLMKQMCQYPTSLGYSTISFDYTGHGKSHGKFKDVSISQIIQDKNLVINYAKKHFKNIYLISLSFGAHPLIHEASINKSIKGAVLINPATDMFKLVFRKKTSSDLDKYGKSHRSVGLKTKIKFLFDAFKYNMYKEAKKIKCPVYVYHIKNDGSVPVKQSYNLKKYIKSKNKFVHELRSNHALNKEAKDGTFKNIILHDALTWIKKNS